MVYCCKAVHILQGTTARYDGALLLAAAASPRLAIGLPAFSIGSLFTIYKAYLHEAIYFVLLISEQITQNMEYSR